MYYHIYIYDNYYHSSMTGTIQMYYNIHDNLLWYSDNMTQCHLHNEHVHHIYIYYQPPPVLISMNDEYQWYDQSLVSLVNDALWLA